MLTSDLYPYQTRVGLFAMGRRRCGLFCFYGSGKTYMALKWHEDLSYFGHTGTCPVLVLTLKSLIHQWGKEIEKHSGLSYTLVQGTAAQRVKALGSTTSFHVINYDAVRSPPVLKALREMKFGTVIVDESTMLKEARTQRFKILRSLLNKVPYKILLTGKPILEKPEEIWSQLLFLDDGETFGKSFWKFRDTYFSPGPPWRPYDWELKPNAEQQIAEKLNQSCIRIPKEEIAAELPPKRYIKVSFEMPAGTRERYEQLRKEFSAELLEGGEFTTQWAVTRSQKMHQLCQGLFYKENDEYELFHTMKLDWLQENIPLMLKDGPVLIWVNYLRCIPLIVAALKDIPLRVYTGEMSTKHRAEAVFDFQTRKSGKVNVLILSEQAGCAGLNLQRANQAVFYSTGYWAGMRENAEDRCHRIGSEVHEKVTYYDLVMEKSMDEVVLQAVKDKLDMSEAILKHIRGE